MVYRCAQNCEVVAPFFIAFFIAYNVILEVVSNNHHGPVHILAVEVACA